MYVNIPQDHHCRVCEMLKRTQTKLNQSGYHFLLTPRFSTTRSNRKNGSRNPDTTPCRPPNYAILESLAAEERALYFPYNIGQKHPENLRHYNITILSLIWSTVTEFNTNVALEGDGVKRRQDNSYQLLIQLFLFNKHIIC